MQLCNKNKYTSNIIIISWIKKILYYIIISSNGNYIYVIFVIIVLYRSYYDRQLVWLLWRNKRNHDVSGINIMYPTYYKL